MSQVTAAARHGSDQVVLENGAEADGAVTDLSNGVVGCFVGELLDDRFGVVAGADSSMARICLLGPMGGDDSVKRLNKSGIILRLEEPSAEHTAGL